MYILLNSVNIKFERQNRFNYIFVFRMNTSNGSIKFMTTTDVK